MPALVLVPLLTLALALTQEKVYSANAQVLLTYSNIGAGLNGLPNNYAAIAPTRNVATQAALARTPGVAHQALLLSHVNGSATDLLNKSSVTSSSGDDLLTFTVQASSPQRAMTLASNYATAYTQYRGQLDDRTITASLAGINRQLAALAGSGQANSAGYRFLAHEQEQLLGMQAAGGNDAVLVGPAQTATKVGPHPLRSAVLGLGVGILLAIALVFLLETLDRRASVEEIAERLRLPDLAALPVLSPWWRTAVRRVSAWAEHVATLVRRQLDHERRMASEPVERRPAPSSFSQVASLAVVRDPRGRAAEAFGVLKSSLEFAGLEHEFQSLFLTSARHFRGKTELAANLGVTMARGGRRVLVCDLDGGRGSVTELFGLEGRPGVTEVAMEQNTYQEAMVPVRNELSVLPCGALPLHPGLLGSRAVADLVEGIRHAGVDLVLIDAPPLLDSGEAQTLAPLADAMIVMLADPVRPAVLSDLALTLARLPARPLGFVTVGVGRESSEGTGGDDVTVERDLRPVAAPSNGHRGGRTAGAKYTAIRGSGDPS